MATKNVPPSGQDPAPQQPHQLLRALDGWIAATLPADEAHPWRRSIARSLATFPPDSMASDASELAKRRVLHEPFRWGYVATAGAPEAWARHASIALTEAMTMGESIGAIVARMLPEADAQAFPLLEAINACLRRMDGAVTAAVEAESLIKAEVSHG